MSLRDCLCYAISSPVSVSLPKHHYRKNPQHLHMGLIHTPFLRGAGTYYGKGSTQKHSDFKAVLCQVRIALERFLSL